MALNKENLDTLIKMLDAGIEAEIDRICNAKTEPVIFDSELNFADIAFLHSCGVEGDIQL
jgi:hypothetical protein